MPIKARIYFWIILAVGAYSGFYTYLGFDIDGFPFKTLIFFVVASFLSEIYQEELLPNLMVSVSGAVYIGALLIGGLPLAMGVGLLSLLLSETVIRTSNLIDGATFFMALEKIGFNTAQIVISIWVGWLVFRATGGTSAPFTQPYDYAPPLIAFVAYTVVNISLVSGIISLTEGTSFTYQLKFSLRNLHIQVMSLGVLAILIAVVYESSPWNLFFVAILLLLVNTSLKGYLELRRQAKRTFEKMMELLSKRDPYTHEHSESVGDLTAKIADEMKVNPEKKEAIVSAARVHDIGKLGTPDSILLKPGKLNDEEWEVMKEHPVVGADILSELKIYKDSVDDVRHEHERWDGSGYPDGLESKEIPLGSRIIAVADVWNALVTERPYRGPLPEEVALQEINEMAGVKLDPDAVDAFFKIMEGKEE
ncbi:HD-GYP domain-containing protein [Candidatus Bipolaricaulota bacterium]|nr:HD-GYP domain-containing protein [Candidatus Bipolaricaulota bacterium]